MPHVLLEKDFELNTPLHLANGVCVEFGAKGIYDSKYAISKDGLEFLLTKKQTSQGVLLKYDKYTRVSPVLHIKEAINEIASSLDNQILFCNTHINDRKIIPEEEYLKQIDYFVDEFSFDGEICIEVGFGSGRHILHQAQNNPNKLFIGLEIHTPSIEQMLKQVKLKNIKNILALNYDARLFLEFLKSNTISTIFVHFPVPWPKKPHRRVISHEFVDEALRVLKVGGTLELRTDDEGYYEYAKEIALSKKQASINIQKNQDIDVTSKYETRWKLQEKNIYDVVFTSLEESAPLGQKYEFFFDAQVNQLKLQEKFSVHTYFGGDFFVHFESLYLTNKGGLLLKIAMGSNNKPEAKYILIEEGRASYYQTKPIASKANFKAHQIIMEYLTND